MWLEFDLHYRKSQPRGVHFIAHFLISFLSTFILPAVSFSMGILSKLKSKLEEGKKHNHFKHDPATSNCDRCLSQDDARERERLVRGGYRCSREPIPPVRRCAHALRDIGGKELDAEADDVQPEESISEPTREAATQSKAFLRRPRHTREYATISPASLVVRAATANDQIQAGAVSIVSSPAPALKNFSRIAPPSPVPPVSSITPINHASSSSGANTSSLAKLGRTAKAQTNSQRSTPAPVSCIHKVRTGCRLSYIRVCCACADRRPRDSEYLVYIDGLGVVPRGTRWQGYCSPCSGK